MPEQVTRNLFTRGLFMCALVTILTCFLFLFQLGAKPFWDYDEATYASVIHDTTQSGDLLTLKLGQSPFLQKPPLSFWMSMGFDSVFHHPEFSYRLTAALAGIGSVILVMLITYEFCGNLMVAALAGLILLTTGPFLQEGRELRLDVPATLGILVAVYTFLRGLKSLKWFLGVGIGLALGLFFKSFIGLLSILFLLIWSLVYKDFSWLKSVYVWLGGLLFFIIVLPWHVYEIVKNGDAFWQTYVLSNTAQRFNGAAILTHSYSATDYMSFFLTYAAPWSILFLILAIWLMVNFRTFRSDNVRPLHVAVLCALAIFFVFALSTTKILTYLVPIYPFVAIALGLSVASLYQRHRTLNTPKFIPLLGIAGGILLACGLWVSISYAYHAFSIMATDDTIANDEMHIGRIIAESNSTDSIYTYQYEYWDTIKYYSGGRAVEELSDDQALTHSFFLIVPGKFFTYNHLPPAVEARMTSLYQGPGSSLYKFTY